MGLHVKKALSFFILFLSDLAMLWACIYFVHYVRVWVDFMFDNSVEVSHELYTTFWVYYVVILASFLYGGIYHRHFDFWEEIRRVYRGLIFGLLAVFTWLALTKQSEDYSRFVLFFTFVLLMFVLPILKRGLKYCLTSSKLWAKDVQIVGKKEDTKRLICEIEKNWYLGLKIVKNAPTVIMASRGYSPDSLVRVSEKYLLTRKEVLFVPTLNHINFADADIVELHNIRTSLIEVRNRLKEPFAIFIKTIFDIVFSIVLLPFSFVILFIIGIFIKLDSKGGIFFKQKRLGKNGKVFYCYKFRTMHENSQTILDNYLKQYPNEFKNYQKFHKYKNDPRVTLVGKWLRRTSLDELPQIINIVLGEMSLIGPRPYMYEERHKLGRVSRDILLVKPGITGLWQVSGRSELSFKKRVELDKWYVRNWTLWLDLVILAKTFKTVLARQGAS